MTLPILPTPLCCSASNQHKAQLTKTKKDGWKVLKKGMHFLFLEWTSPSKHCTVNGSSPAHLDRDRIESNLSVPVIQECHDRTPWSRASKLAPTWCVCRLASIQCFEGEVHSRKRKCIPFFSTLPPSFFVVVSCALCWLLALQHRGVWRMGNVIFFSIFNLALVSLRMHFFFKPP